MPHHSPTNHHLTRLLAASVLLLAAYFKYDHLLSPDLASHRLWHLLHLQFELLLGLWLLSNLSPRPAFAVAAFTFATFALVSLYNVVTRSPTCGCFGRVDVNPWLTLAVDVLLVTLLTLWYPPRRPTGAKPRAPRPAYEYTFAAVAGLLTLYTSVQVATYRPGTLHPDGSVTGDARHVSLTPADWLNERFPLAPHLTSAPYLSTGRWTLLFVRHNCPLCHEALDHLRSAAPAYPDRDVLSRILVVELPPYGPLPQLPSPVRATRLRADRHWALPTPTVLKLQDGLVTAATRGYVQLTAAATTAPSPTD
jgi:hypothetical protein